MTKLTFYGGVGCVGGNKILVEDKGNDARFFLDFGLDYNQYGKYFEEYLKPRVGNGLGDFVELDLIPSPKILQGFYRTDLLEINKYPVHKEVLFDGILVSHAHFDHTANISFVDERIPIYASEITIAMAKAVQECGKESFDTEVYRYKRRPIIRGSPFIERNWKSVFSDKEFKIGDMEVKAFSVDHSIPGAMCYLLYTSGGTILYTGDIRSHGALGHLTKQTLEILADEDIDLMLCEGTRIKENGEQSEEIVKKQSTELIKGCKELVIADYAFKDLTRFKTFYEIAKETNRKLAIGLKDAYILKELKKLVDLPSLSDENLLIYLDKRGSGTFCDKDYNKDWMKDILSLKNKITSEDIHNTKDNVIIRLSFYDFNDFVDIKPSLGSEYIHSMCEPFNEEMTISEERMKNWLSRYNLPYRYVHCSGHANRPQLEEIIKMVKPQSLIPIHTEYPKEFERIHNNVMILKINNSYEVG